MSVSLTEIQAFSFNSTYVDTSYYGLYVYNFRLVSDLQSKRHDAGNNRLMARLGVNFSVDLVLN